MEQLFNPVEAARKHHDLVGKIISHAEKAKIELAVSNHNETIGKVGFTSKKAKKAAENPMMYKWLTALKAENLTQEQMKHLEGAADLQEGLVTIRVYDDRTSRKAKTKRQGGDNEGIKAKITVESGFMVPEGEKEKEAIAGWAEKIKAQKTNQTGTPLLQRAFPWFFGKKE